MKLWRIACVFGIIVGLNLQLLAVETLPRSNRTGDGSTAKGRECDEAPEVNEISQRSVAGIGTVTLSSVTERGTRSGLRIRVEDETGFADSIDIDTASG